MLSKLQLHELLAPSGQEHVINEFDSLSAQEQEHLQSQVVELAPLLMHYNRVFLSSLEALDPTATADVTPPNDKDIALMTERFVREDAQRTTDVKLMREEGMRAIREGEVAVLVLAGGSGTRLGQTFPKGMLVCPDLVQQKSLFQLHCEKIQRLESISQCHGKIPLLLMTSPQTDEATRVFFAEHHYFGMDKDRVIFFVQSALPCYDREGKILMESPGRIATAPGGNGGIYEALSRSGTLETIVKGGVKFVQVVTVDNILAKLGDPLMVGFTRREGADVVVKSTPKISDREAVGVFAKRNGKWGVVEYTEIGDGRASARNLDGSRMYDAANIAIHLMHVDFLKRAAHEMETYERYHAALKSIPTSNGPVAGVKLEAFIFDLFEFASEFRILQVDRSTEFSPIKNADDNAKTKSDTPFTAVRDLHTMHTKWVCAAAGVDSTEIVFEVAANVSYDGEGLCDGVAAASIQEAAKDSAAVFLVQQRCSL
jgi:UDP-N-acetylglucosamine/UDP-N-acetylgalactosamine diphosphorylase